MSAPEHHHRSPEELSGSLPWYRRPVDMVSKTVERDLQQALAAELRAIQGVANITVRTWVADTPVSPDSVYRVLRGDRPVSVVELLLLCRVIEEDPFDLIARAMKRAEGLQTAT